MTKKLQSEDGHLRCNERSETAATVGNKLYGPSGAMDYRVVLAQSGGARTSTTINAATGDEAAEQALQKYPGWKVAYVGPSTESSVRLTDDMVAE